MPADFHEIRFPLDVALGSRGGPVRRTDIVTLASGREHRNSRWSGSRRRYDAGLGVRTVDALHAVLAFFEERRGRLYGFRFHDRMDCKSCAPSGTPSPADSTLGVGDGTQTAFHLAKTYGSGFAPYRRTVAKPVAGTVRVAVNGSEIALGAAASCDPATGIVSFAAAPAAGALVTAGFAFDVPVRFDADALDVDLSAFEAGAIPSIPLVEIIP
ncbi:MAG: glycoside hydrolase family 24 [Enterovirga sp.]|nr:glycoside hydrolase family 24 [Enterovirga sp.]